MRVLFTTPVDKIPDYFYISVRRRFLRYSVPVPACGLRFLKENIPGVEILEFPTWGRFEAELRKGGIDTLGISFYMKDGNTVLKMIEMARKYGVKNIWGGNYGVLCDEIAAKFDRVFTGYSENNVRKALGMEPLGRIRHPVIKTKFGLYGTPFKFKQGFLYTTRGCNFDCSFCQTKSFVPEMSRIPIESVEEVLLRYKKMGIGFLFITDENFLSDRSHGERVISLLEEHGFAWGTQTRIDNISHRVEELKERGLFIVQVGIESFNQNNLLGMNKGISTDMIYDTLRRLNDNDIYIHGYYILGHESDTRKSLKRDIYKLANLNIDSTQITILTPFPKTRLWEQISGNYGIIESDYSKFDTYHLTWNHPNFRRKELHELRNHAWKSCFTLGHMYSGFAKSMKNHIPRKMMLGPGKVHKGGRHKK